MDSSKLIDGVLELVNINTAKLTAIQERFMNVANNYQYSPNQTELPHTATSVHLSEVASLSASANDLLDDTAEAWGKVIRLKHLDTLASHKKEIQMLENLVASQEETISKVVEQHTRFIEWQKSLKIQVEQAASNNKKAKASQSASVSDVVQGAYSGMLTVMAVGMVGGVLGKMVSQPSKTALKDSYQSSVDTGKKFESWRNTGRRG